MKHFENSTCVTNWSKCFQKLLIQSNVQDFYTIMNELDPELQLIFKELTININFIDITLGV